MGKRLFVLGAVAMLFAVAVATPASAAKPLDVAFEVTTYFAPAPTDTFEASGPAVDAGLMCAEGTKTEVVPEQWSPPDPEKVTRNGQVISRYTCTEKPFVGDSFVLKVQMHFDVSVGGSAWVANWVMMDATGDLAGLHGNGSGFGSLLFDGLGPPIGADDSYTGRLH